MQKQGICSVSFWWESLWNSLLYSFRVQITRIASKRQLQDEDTAQDWFYILTLDTDTCKEDIFPYQRDSESKGNDSTQCWYSAPVIHKFTQCSSGFRQHDAPNINRLLPTEHLHALFSWNYQVQLSIIKKKNITTNTWTHLMKTLPTAWCDYTRNVLEIWWLCCRWHMTRETKLKDYWSTL
jgi:hypothetical protein